MNTALALIFLTVAVSYGWGMRGDLLGHGKGAVVPGLLLGLGMVLLTGDAKLLRCAWIPAAFGAVGMFPGGGMTYGETIGLVLHRSAPARGRTGLAFKGFLWFFCAAGLVCFGIRLVSLRCYSLADTLLLFAAVCLARPVGMRLFNRPGGLRFSPTRQESWGENLLILLVLACVFAVHGDWFSLIAASAAGLGGALGWLAGITLFDLTWRGLWLKKLTRAGFCDGWKIMEFSIGALGGLCSGLGLLAASALFPDALSGGWFASADGLSAYIPQTLSLILGLVWCALLPLHALFTELTRKKPWGERVEDWLLDVLYCAVPLLLLGLGSVHTALFYAIPVCFYVLAEEVFLDMRTSLPARIVLAAVSALLTAAAAALSTALPKLACVLVCTAVYVGFELALALRDRDRTRPGLRALGARFSVDLFFLVTSAVSVALWAAAA